MGILDDFKQDCIDNPNVTNGDSALQEEIKKQMKAIADHDANPEILDSKIKFNPEEFDFNEKKSITFCIPNNNINAARNCMRTTGRVLMLNFNSFWSIAKLVYELR